MIQNDQCRTLSLEKIQGSVEIQTWLGQFPNEDHAIATDMLMRLEFVGRDTCSEWLKKSIMTLRHEKTALFAVRKLDESRHRLWDDNGNVVQRPSQALGSEDLIYSIISNCCREYPEAFFDHPGIDDVKNEKIHRFILIDDNIGSGKRVKRFIEAMVLDNRFKKTFFSLLSYNLIHFEILSYAIMEDAKKIIFNVIPGSDHGLRKYRKSKKINFESCIVYQKDDLFGRWGELWANIKKICCQCNKIPKDQRRGFNKVMSNVIFYHSVPNTIPGCLWKSTYSFTSLFPNRVVPNWMIDLLVNDRPSAIHTIQPFSQSKLLSPVLISLLSLLKKGVRRDNILAFRLGIETEILKSYVEQLQASGLITNLRHLTPKGFKEIYNAECSPKKYDMSLYIPKTWCADQ